MYGLAPLQMVYRMQIIFNVTIGKYDVMVASSSSNMPVSSFTSSLSIREQCLIAHPVSSLAYSICSRCCVSSLPVESRLARYSCGRYCRQHPSVTVLFDCRSTPLLPSPWCVRLWWYCLSTLFRMTLASEICKNLRVSFLWWLCGCPSVIRWR